MTLRFEVLGKFFRNSHRRLAKLECPRVINDLRRQKIYRTLPRGIRSVLFVCKGNICRSPFAAVYCEAKLKEGGSHIKVRSAGLETTAGKEAHPLASIAAQQHDLSLQAHVTTPLTRELVNQATLILVMEQLHYATLLQLYPEAKGKVFRLGYFSSTLAIDIVDPYDGTLKDFNACYRVIRQSCDHLLKYLGDMGQ
jgi:protein-tyrosine phosphatase